MFLEGSDNLFSHPATAASKEGSGVSGGKGFLRIVISSSKTGVDKIYNT